jgi:hypothetical protein
LHPRRKTDSIKTEPANSQPGTLPRVPDKKTDVIICRAPATIEPAGF